MDFDGSLGLCRHCYGMAPNTGTPMTPRERKSLAEQLKANPLWDGIQEEMEANAVERMFAANDDMKRLEAQAYARAVRNFRQDCERLLRNTEAKKPAPA